MKIHHFRIDSRKIGPVPLLVGGVLTLALAIGAIVLAAMFAVVFLAVGLTIATVGAVALGVRRFLGGRKADSQHAGAQLPKITELSQREARDDGDVKLIEVEVVD